MLDKILKRIKNSEKITEYKTFNSSGHRIDNRLKIETWSGYCTGIYIDGIEVLIYSKSTEDGKIARELIRNEIMARMDNIKQNLRDSI